MESRLAIILAHYIESYLEKHDIGITAGSDGMLKLKAQLVRIPDVSFISEERLPGGATPKEKIPAIAPDLAVEILSESNTPKEMARKLREYFDAGSRLVWYVDPTDRSVQVYTAVDASTRLSEDDALDGDPVLPGFRLAIRQWFDRAERRPR
jgi:Uma2 family endonuclease